MRPALALVLLSLAACDREAPVPADAGESPLDASSSDAAAPGADAGEPSPDAGSGPDAANCRICVGFGTPAQAGTLATTLNETSGLAASRDHAGVLYGHNDSGDSARFFAFEADGALLGTYALEGASARDWEDMALGPCPAGTCLFLADVGDNGAVRTDYAVYRVPEPDVRVGQAAGAFSLPGWERLPFEYPGGAKHNCETLLAHPATGDLYVVTKEASGTPSEVYRFPAPQVPGQTATLVKVATLPIPKPGDSQLTGGDLHPCGAAMLLRTYNTLYLFEIEASSPFETIFTATPRTVPVAFEPQGEAVCWRADGRGYFTASEGSGAPLNAVACP